MELAFRELRLAEQLGLALAEGRRIRKWGTDLQAQVTTIHSEILRVIDGITMDLPRKQAEEISRYRKFLSTVVLESAESWRMTIALRSLEKFGNLSKTLQGIMEACKQILTALLDRDRELMKAHVMEIPSLMLDDLLDSFYSSKPIFDMHIDLRGMHGGKLVQESVAIHRKARNLENSSSELIKASFSLTRAVGIATCTSHLWALHANYLMQVANKAREFVVMSREAKAAFSELSAINARFNSFGGTAIEMSKTRGNLINSCKIWSSKPDLGAAESLLKHSREADKFHEETTLLFIEQQKKLSTALACL